MTTKSASPRASLLVRLWRSDAFTGYLLIAPIALVVGLLIVAPLAHMIGMSFWTQSGLSIERTWTFDNYRSAIEAPIFQTLLFRSVLISTITTIATILLAWPLAYFVAFHVHRHKMLWIIVLTIPTWISYLLRVFSWKVILGYNGAINSGLIGLGIIDEPISILVYNPVAVVIVLVHAWLPYALLPIYISLEKIDRSMLEAAADLGEGALGTLLRVTLPLSIAGVSAATLIIFIPTVGDFITPQLIGGPDGYMISSLVAEYFGKSNNWPLGAAMSTLSILSVCTIALVYYLIVRQFLKKVG